MMKNYTNYCTAEQTRRAYKLGAPIDRYYGNNGKKVAIGIYNWQIPTTQQIIGWLREKDIDCFVGKQTYARFMSTVCTVNGELFFSSKFDTYEGAELAAIDAALDYLEKGCTK